MRLVRGALSSHAGFSLAELAVVLAVIGMLFSFALPAFLNYYQTAQVRGAAADVAAYINQGRQLAIQMNCSVSVVFAPAGISYNRQANCQTPGVWIGTGTNGAGNIPAPDGITLTPTATPIFTNLGAAAPAATVTVTHGSYSLNVSVSASGRVTVGP
jgi:prepilin-type N-terminal cleavage/methylation domain-containing protein